MYILNIWRKVWNNCGRTIFRQLDETWSTQNVQRANQKDATCYYFSVKKILRSRLDQWEGHLKNFWKMMRRENYMLSQKLCIIRVISAVEVLVSASMPLFIITDYKTLCIQNIIVLYLLKKHACHEKFIIKITNIFHYNTNIMEEYYTFYRKNTISF